MTNAIATTKYPPTLDGALAYERDHGCLFTEACEAVGFVSWDQVEEEAYFASLEESGDDA